MRLELVTPIQLYTHVRVLKAQLVVGESLTLCAVLLDDQGERKRVNVIATGADISLVLRALADADEAALLAWMEAALPSLIEDAMEKEELKTRLSELSVRERGLHGGVVVGRGRIRGRG